MKLADTLKTSPWIVFLVLALVAQQANMMAYKLGGAAALPQVFLAYSFLFQTVMNGTLIAVFKSRGFPVVLPGRMKLWVAFVAFLYLLNEFMFITTYRAGAPYSLLMVIFACCSLILLMLFAVFFLKEKITRRQVGGLVCAFVAIVLIRMA